MEKSQYLEDFKISLYKLDMGDLRQKASKNFGIKLTRQHTKEDIIGLIMEYVAKGNFAEVAEGDLKPGYARIKLMTVAGKVTFPVYQNTNGYSCFIPPGVEVDVPIKVVETFQHAEEMKKVKNEFDEYTDALELSYPFQVIGICPGPDPKPGLEVGRDLKWKPFIEFQKLHGYWPSWRVLQNTLSTGVMLNALKQASEEDKDD